jgi:hypothetical protein
LPLSVLALDRLGFAFEGAFVGAGTGGVGNVGESGKISAIASSTSTLTSPFSGFGAGFVTSRGEVWGDSRGRVVIGSVCPDVSFPFFRGGISGVILCSDLRCFVNASDRVNVFPQSTY